MLKLKDLILENPADYVDKDVDKMDMLYRKKKYNFYEADGVALQAIKNSNVASTFYANSVPAL